MADIRALMAQERQARRINHEYASYSKTGMLMCTACQLNIKSETLWEGHLKSANHKASVKRLHQAQRPAAKRKIDDLEENETTEEVDMRKKLKPKPRVSSETINTPLPDRSPRQKQVIEEVVQNQAATPETTDIIAEPLEPAKSDIQAAESTFADNPQVSAAKVDEDEWAAFEREVAPLAQPDYSAATITAAPITAAQLEAEVESDRRKLRDTEAEDEKEDEGRRMEEEFEVMEEMEERVRKLKEKREALRVLSQAEVVDTGQAGSPVTIEHNDAPSPEEKQEDTADNTNDDDDDADADDWYS